MRPLIIFTTFITLLAPAVYANQYSDLELPEIIQLDFVMEDLGLNDSDLGELSSLEVQELQMMASRPPRHKRKNKKYRPGRPGSMPPQVRPFPRTRPKRQVVCIVEDNMGYRYRAQAKRVFKAENKALRKCFKRSYRHSNCEVIGCRRIRR